ncbi:MAG TPA: hypothetical protein VM123_11095 [archaeon]|nr:hypothetical protein [archaeon]
MENKKSELTEETLGRYYDGELDEAARKELEARIPGSPEARALLERHKSISSLMGILGESMEADELTVRRNWDKIALSLEKRPGRFRRRLTYWLTLAAAAIIVIFIYDPLHRTSDNELVIESIDCTYASFMILRPETQSGHTIIWINDDHSTAN